MVKNYITEKVKSILKIKEITQNKIYKNNGEISKVFRVTITDGFLNLSKAKQQEEEVKFREFLESTESEVQITLKTMNYSAKSYVDRIKSQIKKQLEFNRDLLSKEAELGLSNFLKYIKSKSYTLPALREYYITLSYDDYKIEKLGGDTYDGNRYLKYLESLKSGSNSKIDKILNYQRKYADIVFNNYLKKKEEPAFWEREIKLLNTFFQVEELDNDHIAGLYNSFFYESIYTNNKFYTIINLIEEYAEQEKNTTFLEYKYLFEWEYKVSNNEASINNRYLRIAGIFDYPKSATSNFWDNVFVRGNYDLNFYYKQTSNKQVLEELEKRYKNIDYQLSEIKKLDKEDEALELSRKNYERYIEFIKNQNDKSDEKMFILSTYILLKGVDYKSLSDLSKRLSILWSNSNLNARILPVRDLSEDIKYVVPINSNGPMKNYKFITSSSLMKYYPFMVDFSNLRNLDRVK
ncbi:MAG: hypothetical protein HRU03_01630 [Nanoarchaeales archaeon]|nr:hypothetical protein [Nanoarchaeales archaeon]